MNPSGCITLPMMPFRRFGTQIRIQSFSIFLFFQKLDDVPPWWDIVCSGAPKWEGVRTLPPDFWKGVEPPPPPDFEKKIYF